MSGVRRSGSVSAPLGGGEGTTVPSLGEGTEERVTASVGPDDGAQPALAALREGDILAGKYRVDGVLGGGGMGVVFAATHLHLHSRVALKVLRPTGEHRGPAVTRLLREARAGARLHGEHVARVLDVGALDTGAPYIVMEHLDGLDFGAELRARGPWSVEDAVECVLQACEAVAQAHAAGIVHRDLKPSNLFLTRRADGSPCVKVLDFGIAKALDAADDDTPLTGSRVVLGSPAYMSPEQIRSAKTVDARTDVWSLGVILFELLTGERAFAGDSASARLAAITADPPRSLRDLRPELPAALEAVILGCLEKDTARRTPSVAALARALAPFAPARAAGSIARVEASLREPPALREAEAEAEESPPPVAPAPRRGRRTLGAIAAALLAVAAVTYGVRATRTAPALDPAFLAGDPGKPRRAVAVLGFKNLSGRPEAAWLSTALAEMFGTELAVGERIRVIPSEDVARAFRDLGAADVEGLPDRERAQTRLGADVLVHGAYLVIGDGAARKVRLDVRIDGAGAGRSASIAETGTEAELFDLVARVGARLRGGLGVGALSAQEASSVRAALPASPEAARLYAEGLTKLRLHDALGAQTSLAASTAADPAFPLGHAALAEAWADLGRDAEAKAEAKRAFDLSSGLSREERLLVEGRYRETMRSWDEAISIYRGLFGFFPDNLEYGLLLAQAERRSSKGKETLATVEALHRLPTPAGEDPRIDLEEAAAAEILGDHRREQEAAGRALSRAEALGARNIAARARMPLAWAILRLGDPKRAQELYEQARQLFAAEGDRGLEAQALTNLAIVHAEQGRTDEAQKLFETALAIQRAQGNRHQIANLLNNLARLIESRGQPGEARARYEEALAIHREEGNLHGQSLVLGNIATTYALEGDWPEARRAHEEQLSLVRKLGAEDEIATTTNNLGNNRLDQGDLAAAKLMYEEALPLCRKLEDKECTANSLSGLADVLYEQGELVDAGKRCEEALSLRRQTDAKEAAAHLVLRLADLAMERGDPKKAESLAREALTVLHEAEDLEEASASGRLLQALLAQNKRAEAEAEATRAAALFAAVKIPDARLALALALAAVEAAPGNAAARERGLKDAEAATADLKKVSATMAMEARAALAGMEIAAGRPAGAAHLDEVRREATKLGFLRIARRAAAPPRR